MDRRCEFWLEFENGTKMFAEMLDPVPAQTDLIPPQNLTKKSQLTSPRGSKKEVNITEANDSIEPISRTGTKGGILKSGGGNREESETHQKKVVRSTSSDYIKDKGASLTFTYREGLVV